MTFETIGYQPVGAVVTITLKEQRLSPSVHRELYQAWKAFRYDPALQVAVLTGSGAVFCLGDSDPAYSLGRPGPEALGWWYEHYRVRESNVWKPVVLAVNGDCAASGMTFVGQADLVLCSDQATFSLPQVADGEVPWREVAYLADRLPLPALSRLALGGRRASLSASRAQALGLVQEVVPATDLVDRATARAEAIAAQSGDSVRAAAACLHLSRDLGYLDGLMMAFSVSDRYQAGRDSREGPIAFAEKRRAEWSAGEGAASST